MEAIEILPVGGKHIITTLRALSGERTPLHTDRRGPR
jgi:hypothetical protein